MYFCACARSSLEEVERRSEQSRIFPPSIRVCDAERVLVLSFSVEPTVGQQRCRIDASRVEKCSGLVSGKGAVVPRFLRLCYALLRRMQGI